MSEILPKLKNSNDQEDSSSGDVIIQTDNIPIKKSSQTNEEAGQNPSQINEEVGQNPSQVYNENTQNPIQANEEVAQNPSQINEEVGQNPSQTNEETGQNPSQTNEETGQNPSQVNEEAVQNQTDKDEIPSFGEYEYTEVPDFDNLREQIENRINELTPEEREEMLRNLEHLGRTLESLAERNIRQDGEMLEDVEKNQKNAEGNAEVITQSYLLLALIPLLPFLPPPLQLLIVVFAILVLSGEKMSNKIFDFIKGIFNFLPELVEKVMNEATKEQNNTVRKSIEQAKLNEKMLTPKEKVEDKIKELEDKYENKKITKSKYNDEIKKLKKQRDEEIRKETEAKIRAEYEGKSKKTSKDEPDKGEPKKTDKPKKTEGQEPKSGKDEPKKTEGQEPEGQEPKSEKGKPKKTEAQEPEKREPEPKKDESKQHKPNPQKQHVFNGKPVIGEHTSVQNNRPVGNVRNR